MRKIGSPSTVLRLVKNPHQCSQTHDITGKRYPTWLCSLVKNTLFWWSIAPQIYLGNHKKRVFLTIEHSHVGYHFPAISWVWEYLWGFLTNRSTVEGDPIFLKKPYFFNFTENGFGIFGCWGTLVYVSICLPNSNVIANAVTCCVTLNTKC